MDQTEPMAVCPSCGAPVAQSTLFCNHCGNKMTVPVICKQCGAIVPDGCAFCQQCGTKVDADSFETADTSAGKKEEFSAEDTPASEPAEAAVYTQQTEDTSIPVQTYAVQPPIYTPEQPTIHYPQQPSSAPVMNGRKRPLGIKLLAAVLAVTVIGGAGAYVYFSRPTSNLSICYLKDNEIYQTGLSKIKPVQLTSKLYENSSDDASSKNCSIYQSKDGRYIFYPDKLSASDDGYSLYYRDLTNSKTTEGTKIDSDVKSEFQISDAGTLAAFITTDGDLYTYDLKNKNKIDDKVSKFYLSPDGSRMYYILEDGSLYQKDIAGKKEPDKISSNAAILSVTKDLSYIFYSKDSSLYRKAFTKSEDKIDTDLKDFIGSFDDGTAYYSKGKDKDVSLSDYVEDDMADADAKITEPNINDYESTTPYTDIWGNTYNNYNYNFDSTGYAKAYEAYSQKQARDTLRSSLKSKTISISNAAIYYYDGTNENAVSEDFDISEECSAVQPVIIYKKYVKSDISKVKLSEITSSSDVETKVKDAMTSSTEVHAATKAADTKLEQKNSNYYTFNSSGTAFYYLDEYSTDKDCGTLMEAKIEKNKIDDPEKIDDNVSNFGFPKKSDTLIYIKDVKDSSGDLYVNKTQVDSDVSNSTISILDGASELVYLTDYNESDETGTLKFFNGKSSVKVADDVSLCDIVDKTHIIYIDHYNSNDKTGDLECYDGSSKIQNIDTDVSNILVLSSAE